VRSLCYENQFSFLLKLELIIITRTSLRVALKERLRETREWPTVCSSTTVIRIERLRNILIQMQVL